MAGLGISQSIAALNAYSSQAQSGGAQNPPASLQRKDVATQTRLSAFGRVQYSLADLQARAQALRNFNKPPTLDDFKTVVQGFVHSFNALGTTVGEVSGQKHAALNEDIRPGQALSEVRKALAGAGDASATLQKQGVDRLKDGGLAVNQKVLGQAFLSNRQGALDTFAEVAGRVGKAIDKQLSNNGIIGSRMQDLSTRTNELETSRHVAHPRLDHQKSFQQHLAAQLAHAGGYVARNAVATYFSVASM